jgi:hypothetical protein
LRNARIQGRGVEENFQDPKIRPRLRLTCTKFERFRENSSRPKLGVRAGRARSQPSTHLPHAGHRKKCSASSLGGSPHTTRDVLPTREFNDRAVLSSHLVSQKTIAPPAGDRGGSRVSAALNKIGLFLAVTCFRHGVPRGALRRAVRQFSLAQNRGNFCYLSDAPRWRTARARRLLRSSTSCVSPNAAAQTRIVSVA